MQFLALSNEQRRQLIDAQQAFKVWREADREFRHGYPPLYKGYRAKMHWKRIKGKEYLYRAQKELGPRSAKTEQIKEDYTEQRTRLRSRLTRLESRLEEMRAVNRAMKLARVPKIAARVLRRLDRDGLLGKHVFVAGTHALYAYEARSGIIFSGELMATTDIDFLWDARQRFTFVMRDVSEVGILGLLRQVDPTFKRTATFRAANDDPYLVELIRPLRPNEALRPALKASEVEGDLEPAAIEGLEWLLNAPKFEEVVIDEEGRPLMLDCIDPRAFALHKLWLSRQPMREGVKRRRDAMQAHAVAAVAIQHLGLKFDRRELTALPKELAQGARELAKANIDLAP